MPAPTKGGGVVIASGFSRGKAESGRGKRTDILPSRARTLVSYEWTRRSPSSFRSSRQSAVFYHRGYRLPRLDADQLRSPDITSCRSCEFRNTAVSLVSPSKKKKNSFALRNARSILQERFNRLMRLKFIRTAWKNFQSLYVARVSTRVYIRPRDKWNSSVNMMDNGILGEK